MDSVETPTCQELIRGEGRWPEHRVCGRPIKDDGLCGIHLAAKRKREANHEAWQRKMAESQDAHATARAACARLAEMGIKAHPHYSSFRNGGHTGGVVIESPAEVERLLRMLDAAR